MKNVTNLEIKRQRVGLIKELSAFAVVGVYKKATMKTKLELIGLIEVFKHTEKNYNEALDLIFKLEKAKDSTQLINKLSKNHLEAKVLSDVERLAMAPKTPSKRNKKDVPVTQEPSYYEKHKTIILVMSGFIGMLLLLIIIKPSSNTNKQLLLLLNQNKKTLFV